MRGRGVRIGCGLLMLWLTTGCSIYKIAGNAVSDYAVSDLGPFILSTEDVEMGCQTGQAATLLFELRPSGIRHRFTWCCNALCIRALC